MCIDSNNKIGYYIVILIGEAYMRLTDVPVDAGMVAVVSKEFIAKYKGKYRPTSFYPTCTYIDAKGPVNATLKVRGYGEAKGLVKTQTGVYVGDPCYLFKEQWSQVLKDTDYFRKPSEDYVLVDTDDGGHTVTVTLKAVKSPKPAPTTVLLTKEECKALVDCLDALDKDNDGISAPLQAIGEKLWAVAYPGK
ncbi:Uncharacterised protein [uncultured archaeon]|nr:Uncharacterised protein [uncultured archaeon]